MQFNTQKNYSVPDNELKLELISKSIDTVLPAYRTFLSKFKDIEFGSDEVNENILLTMLKNKLNNFS